MSCHVCHTRSYLELLVPLIESHTLVSGGLLGAADAKEVEGEKGSAERDFVDVSAEASAVD